MPGHWSKYEHPFHVSPTPSQHDAIDAIELALAAYQEMFGHPLADLSPIDEATGETKTVLTIVTDDVAPFRSLRFASVHHRPPERTAPRPHPGKAPSLDSVRPINNTRHRQQPWNHSSRENEQKR